jgi:hypothetical protein
MKMEADNRCPDGNSLLATIFGVAKSFDTIQDTTHQNVIVDSR